MKSKLSNHNLGHAIRETRISGGITQVQLSNRIQCNQSFLSAMESGAKRISMKNIQRICKALDMTPRQLVALATGVNKDSELIDIIFDFYKNN